MPSSRMRSRTRTSGNTYANIAGETPCRLIYRRVTLSDTTSMPWTRVVEGAGAHGEGTSEKGRDRRGKRRATTSELTR